MKRLSIPRCLIYIGLFILLYSCAKSHLKDEDKIESVSIKPPSDSLGLLLTFLENNSQKRIWADPTLFAWIVISSKLDDVTINSQDGIGYWKYPQNDFFPHLFQKFEDYMRYFSIGDRSPKCINFREEDIFVNLKIISNGKVFLWFKCPIRIMEYKTNPYLNWPGKSPKEIILIVQNK